MVADGNLLYVGTSNGKVVTIPISALCTDVAQEWCIISQGSLEEKTIREEEDTSATTKKSKESKEEKKKGRHSKEPPDEEDKKGRRSKEPPNEERKQKRTKENKHSREEDKAGKKSPESKNSKEPKAPSLKEEAKAREVALQEMRAHSLSRSAVAVHSHMDERVRDLLFLRLPEMKLSKLKPAAEMMQYHSLPNLASPYGGGRIPVSPPILSFRSLVLSVGRGHVEYVGGKGEEDGGRHRERHEAFQLLVWGHKNLTTS